MKRGDVIHMGYNLEIEERIRKIVSRRRSTDSRKMFGGVCHLIEGNIFCGVYKDFLILRLGESASREALKAPFTKPFDITGKPMKGWVMIERSGFGTDDELEAWLERARNFVHTLPPKKP